MIEELRTFPAVNYLARATFHPDGTADLTIVEADGTEHVLRLVKQDGKLAAFGKDGEILARAARD